MDLEGHDSVKVLLARAILDIELKMRHEIRQNNATLLAKIEKNYDQMNKKLTSVETKVDSLLVAAAHSHNPYSPYHQQHNIAASRGARTFYTRPNVNSAGSTHPHQAGGNRGARGAAANHRQQQQKIPPFGRSGTSSAATSEQPFVFTPPPKFDLDAKQRPNGGSGLKQTLGTLTADKTQLGGWTTRAAVGDYTDEEESGEESEESAEEVTQSTDGPEKDAVGNGMEKGENYYQQEITCLGGSLGTTEIFIVNGRFVAKFESGQSGEVPTSSATEASNSSSKDSKNENEVLTATPGASITSAVSGAGGFGRSRRQ